MVFMVVASDATRWGVECGLRLSAVWGVGPPCVLSRVPTRGDTRSAGVFSLTNQFYGKVLKLGRLLIICRGLGR